MAINEERSYTEYNVEVPTTDFPIGFDILDDGLDVVAVTLNDVDPTTLGYTVIQVNNTTYRFAPAVPSGVVRLTRITDIDQMAHVFTEGAIFISENMDGNFKQIRHAQQEVRDEFSKLRDDIGFTNLEQTVMQVQATYQDTLEAKNAAEQSATTSVVTLAAVEVQANLTQDYANAANAAKDIAQQSATDATTQVGTLKTYVDAAVGAISTDASKQYATLALANAGISSINLNKNIFVSEAANGGYWYKATAGSTSLTKSAYDPLTQAKSYTNQMAKDIPEILGNLGVFVDGAYLKYASTGKIYKENISDIKTIILDVSVGEDYLLHSSNYGGVKPYYVVDASGSVITEPQLIQGATLYGISIPANGVKLYINRPNTVISTFSLRKSSKVDNKVAEKVNNVAEQVVNVEARLYNGLDSWFTDGAPTVNQTVFNTGTALEISYTSNPRVMNATGQAAYLFPQGTTKFSLPQLPAYSVMYVESLAKNTFSDTKYLQLSDIKIASFLANIDLSGKTILAFHSGASHPSFVGAVGRKYRDDLTFQINTIKNNVTSLSNTVNGFNLPSGVATTFPEKPNYQGVLREKCPSFYEHYKLKDKDVVVCLSGSSMTQGNLYATSRPDGATRPPLMHTNDYASHIYDKLELQWDKQQYRRYDHADLTYAGGGWSVTNDLKVGLVSVWDDKGESHNGLTKTTTDASAKVSVVIPKGAYQFNFIYRTDSNGANSKVSITEGAGKVEVYNDTAWVEAHNYTFSMLEPVATATKGNTVYQKRLKMRCKNRYGVGGIDSRGAAKTITISNTSSTSGNFNVVGFEWSPREFMLTIINAARGGGQWGLVAANNLENFQDGDIWIHKPDLVLMEVTGINWGASADIYGDYRSYINIARRTYFNEFNDSPNSYAEKSLLAGNETMFYASSVSAAAAYDWIFDTESGDQLFGTITKTEKNGAAGVPEDASRLGGVTNGFDNMYAIDHYMQSKGVFYAQSTAAFKEVAEKYYDGFYFAMRPSGKSGLTLSADGTHYNDNGAALWAHMITSVFDNL